MHTLVCTKTHLGVLFNTPVLRVLHSSLRCISVCKAKERQFEKGRVIKLCYCSMSRHSTSALEGRLAIRAVQKIKLCLAKILVEPARSTRI